MLNSARSQFSFNGERTVCGQNSNQTMFLMSSTEKELRDAAHAEVSFVAFKEEEQEEEESAAKRKRGSDDDESVPW